MNARIPTSVSGLNRLLKVLSLRQCKRALSSAETLTCTEECRTLLTPSNSVQPHSHETCKSADTAHSVSSQQFNETSHCRLFPTFSLSLTTHPARTLTHEHRPPPPPTIRKQRQLHTSPQHHTHLTSASSRRNATQTDQARSKKRIPLRQVEDIEEVLTQHAEVILEFAEVLGCGEVAMRDMVRRDTRLVTQFDKEAVMAKMRLLLDNGFAPAEILSRYQVFSRSYDRILTRLRAMEPVKRYKHSIAILLLSDPDFKARMDLYLKEVAVMGDHPSQASFMADLLECTQEELMTLVEEQQHEFLLTMPPSRLEEVVSLLRSYGFSAADMRRKCLMLKCLPDVARERLRHVVEAGVFDRQLVPYILTNSDAHFQSSFATWVDNAQALGEHANERELLMHKLQCSEEDIKVLMKRKRQVARMRPGKIARCVDVLREEVGLSPETILRHGSLLYYSPRRLQARWALLRPLDLSEAARARELQLSEKQFAAKYGYWSDG
ncbi:uncharacterized protein LOC143277017 [Babylonia areolata]|uniref:uncharacterized protein LOC143277017 n=1 Tax=Babylonia areolata TaxID=304850 RepID=UPI003FD3FA21